MLLSSNQDLLQYVDGSEGRAELQEGVDTMLAVLKCLNDSMHQVAITAFPVRHMQAYFLFRWCTVLNRKRFRLLFEHHPAPLVIVTTHGGIIKEETLCVVQH